MNDTSGKPQTFDVELRNKKVIWTCKRCGNDDQQCFEKKSKGLAAWAMCKKCGNAEKF